MIRKQDLNAPGGKGALMGFIVLMLGLMALNGVFDMLTLRPVGVHMWAMCDRASIARNYFQESMNFFEPRVHETREFDGITGLEFPFMNYSAAVLYSLFGFNEFWYRLLMLVLLAGGMLFSFRIGMTVTNSFIASACPSLFLLASPVLNYYAAGFIPDVASLAFALLSWFFFFRLKDRFTTMNMVLMWLTITLACLIKVTSLINLVVMVVLLIADKAGLLKSVHEGFRKHWLQITSLGFTVLLVFLWYRYAEWLSKEHHCNVFLMNSRPAQNFAEIKDVLKHIREIWLRFYFPPFMNWIILASVLAFIFLVKYVNRLLWLIASGLWCGNIAFFMLMLHQFRDHDYYIITLMPALFFTWLSLAELIERKVNLKAARITIPVASGVALFLSSLEVKEHIAFRLRPDCWMYNWQHLTDLPDIEPFVDRLGVDRNSKVVAMYDRSPNIVLYYLNRKGWSLAPESSDEEIEYVLKAEPDWLVLHDTALYNKAVLSGYFDPAAENKGQVYFYKRKRK